MENKLNGKTVGKAIFKTIVILAGVLLILILDVAVIRGVCFGLKFIGDEISEVVEDFTEWLPETEAKEEEEEAPETEKKRSSEEILKEENEKLDKIIAAQEAAKGT